MLDNNLNVFHSLRKHSFTRKLCVFAFSLLTTAAGIAQNLFTTQPTSALAPLGGYADYSFSVAGGGALNFGVLVFKSGVDVTSRFSGFIRGSTTISNGRTSTTGDATLRISNITAFDVGSYTFEVTSNNVRGPTNERTSQAVTLSIVVEPQITAHPQSLNLVAGQAMRLFASASGFPAPTFRWLKNETAISGATASELTIASVQVGDSGNYRVEASNLAGVVSSSTAVVSVTPVSRLSNLSVLTDITTPGDSVILGYVVGGTGTLGAKPLVIRAAGPSLGTLGVPGTLADPKLETFAGSTSTGVNDDWGGSPSLTAALAAVGAFAYAGPTSKDSAVAANITSRDNSVAISSANGGTGKVIAEIYDATPSAGFTSATPRLVNVSVRRELGTGLRWVLQSPARPQKRC